MTARTLIVTLAASALVATPAIAITGTTAPKTLDQSSSVGTFDAEGRGVVVVRGRLTVYGKITGILSVRDTAGNAVVKINGVVQRGRLVRGVRIYSFRRGTRAFYIRGRAIRVSMSTGSRGRLHVSAFGRGSVLRMRGQGTYTLNNDAVRRGWTDARLPLAIRVP